MRTSPATLWIGNGLLAAAVVALAFWQWRAGQDRRAELATLQGISTERARLEAQHARLQASRTSDAELARLRTDHAALERLGAELGAVNSRTDARLKPPPAPDEPQAGPLRPATEWRNAGRASPAAALETVAWAARSKDVATLASLLVLTKEGEEAIAAALAVLPEAERRQYPEPQQVVAREMVEDFRVAGFRLIPSTNEKRAIKTLSVQMVDPDGKERGVGLLVEPYGSDGWSVRMPTTATSYYLERFKKRMAAGLAK